MKGDGLREGFSTSSFATAFELGVTKAFRVENFDLRVDASLTTASIEELTVVGRNRPGRVGRERPGMKVLLVLTSETTTFSVVSLDSVVVDCVRPRRVVKNFLSPGVVVSTSAVFTLYTVVYSLVRSKSPIVVSIAECARSEVGPAAGSVAISLMSSARRLSMVSVGELDLTVGRLRTTFVIGESSTVPLTSRGSVS